MLDMHDKSVDSNEALPLMWNLRAYLRSSLLLDIQLRGIKEQTYFLCIRRGTFRTGRTRHGSNDLKPIQQRLMVKLTNIIPILRGHTYIRVRLTYNNTYISHGCQFNDM